MRVHPKGVLVGVGFAALCMLALDARLGIAAIAAAPLIDWLLVLGPPFAAARRNRGAANSLHR